MPIWGQKTQPRKDISDRNEIQKLCVLLICYISPHSFFCNSPPHFLTQVCTEPITCLNIFLNFEILLAALQIWDECFPWGKESEKIQSLLLREDSRTYLLLGRSHKKEFWHATRPNQRRVWGAIKMKWWFEAIMNFFTSRWASWKENPVHSYSFSILPTQNRNTA